MLVRTNDHAQRSTLVWVVRTVSANGIRASAARTPRRIGGIARAYGYARMEDNIAYHEHDTDG